MKQMILLGLVALLAGCVSVGRIPPKHRQAFESLVGTWQEPNGETTVIQRAGNNLVISSIIDSDGEEFIVQDVSFDEGVLEWTYVVPSTKYVVTMRSTSIAPDQLNCTWQNEYTSGSETLYRKE